MSSPIGPFKLVTVNTAPDRAKRLVGRVIVDVKDQYTIIHAGNAESPEQVSSVVSEHKPDILFTASMWTPEQAAQIISDAKTIVPNLKTFSLPQGLQVEKGPDAVVEYIKEHLPALIEG